MLGRPGHRHIAVNGPFDPRAERHRIDEDDQVELPNAASQVSRIEFRSAIDPWMTGLSLLRIEVGTLAAGSAALMTGSASAMISIGVR